MNSHSTSKLDPLTRIRSWRTHRAAIIKVLALRYRKDLSLKAALALMDPAPASARTIGKIERLRFPGKVPKMSVRAGESGLPPEVREWRLMELCPKVRAGKSKVVPKRPDHRERKGR